MNDDALDQLSRENPVPGPLPPPPIEPLLARLGGRPPDRRRSRLGPAGLVLGICVAVAVALLAVVLPGRGHERSAVSGRHAAPAPPAPPSQSTVASYLTEAYRATVSRDRACAFRSLLNPGTGTVSERAPSRTLLSVLSVLRRPATAADRLPAGFGNGAMGRGSVVYHRYIRRARVVDGVSYYLVPERVEPPPNAVPLRCYAEQRAALQSLVAPLPPTKRAAVMRSGTQMLTQERQASAGLPRGPYDGIEIVAGSGASCCDGASSLEHQVSVGIHGQTAYGLVADGVASVTLYYAHADSQDPLTIIAKATHTVTATVTDNMYVVNVGQWGRPAAVVYRAANGAVLRRFDTNQ